MTILDEIRTHLLRAQQVRDQGNGQEDIRRAQRRTELIDSIGLLLKQHQETLLQQAEADLKEKALAAVKQESELLRREVYEHVLSANSETQRAIESVLSDARAQILQRVGDEVSAILDGMDARLLDALGVPLPEPAPALPVESQEDVEALQPGTGPAQFGRGTEPEAAPAAEPEELYQHEVSVVIKPPLRLPRLMEFYGRLWQVHNLSAIQTSGSIDKGITLELRLTEPKPLQQVLRDITCVESACDSSERAPGNSRRTINVTLKPLAEGDSHEQR